MVPCCSTCRVEVARWLGWTCIGVLVWCLCSLGPPAVLSLFRLNQRKYELHDCMNVIQRGRGLLNSLHRGYVDFVSLHVSFCFTLLLTVSTRRRMLGRQTLFAAKGNRSKFL